MMLASLFVEGQTKRSTKTRKPPVIRESVTIKGDLPPAKPPLRETDPDAWRKLRFPEHKLTVEIPARLDDEMNMDAEAEGFWSVDSDTEKATYRIVVKQLPVVLDSSAAAEVLDESIASTFGGGQQSADQAKIRELNYRGRPGREITSIENGKVQIFRVFIIEQKMYALFVTISRRDQWPALDIWVRKFHDSFRVELPTEDEA